MRCLNPKQRRLVHIAWREVEKFIHDWQKNPYRWDKERDIQVELTSRIKSAYKKIKIDTVWAKYKKSIDPAFWEQRQIYNRVCCEPPIYYKDQRGKRNVCRPDILVWDDIKNPDHPNEDYGKKNNLIGILWVCEIKFYRGWGKKVYDKEDNWDLEKLKYLLNQSDGIKYACWLNMERIRPKSGNDISKSSKHGRLRKYYVTLPSNKR